MTLVITYPLMLTDGTGAVLSGDDLAKVGMVDSKGSTASMVNGIFIASTGSAKTEDTSRKKCAAMRKN